MDAAPNVITNDSLLTISNSNFITFAILESRVFTIWNATVSGRLKSDFRISAEITYNNFPLPELSQEERNQLIASGNEILQAREKFTNTKLAELYNPLSMPESLRKAHSKNDAVTLKVFGLSVKANDAAIC